MAAFFFPLLLPRFHASSLRSSAGFSLGHVADIGTAQWDPYLVPTDSCVDAVALFAGGTCAAVAMGGQVAIYTVSNEHPPTATLAHKHTLDSDVEEMMALSSTSFAVVRHGGQVSVVHRDGRIAKLPISAVTAGAHSPSAL